jgi:phosphatidylinositol kinase/protein kinase (PI-3  family)
VVSRELIRVAILWHELWHEGLEEASRLYFTEKNPEGMIAALEPLHNMLEEVSSLFNPLLGTYADIRYFRARRLLARPHSHKYSGGICLKHERHVAGTAFMAR